MGFPEFASYLTDLRLPVPGSFGQRHGSQCGKGCRRAVLPAPFLQETVPPVCCRLFIGPCPAMHADHFLQVPVCVFGVAGKRLVRALPVQQHGDPLFFSRFKYLPLREDGGAPEGFLLVPDQLRQGLRTVICRRADPVDRKAEGPFHLCDVCRFVFLEAGEHGGECLVRVGFI